MLTAARALMKSRQDGGREFPKVDEFYDLYQGGWKPRYGEMSMVSARSGAGKSTFSLFFALKSGLKTLYFSGDMSAFQASVKLACAVRHETIETVVGKLEGGERQDILNALPSNISFTFGEITKREVDKAIDAYVELYNEYPELIVVDNLMDIEGCEDDYKAQMAAMQWLHNLSRELNTAVWVMSHATDKGERGKNSPHEPPPRSEIKNGMSEKPETVLTVALNPHTEEMNVAIVKQRLGFQDASARQYVSLKAVPAESRYERKGGITYKPTGMRETDGGEDTGAAQERQEQGQGSGLGTGGSEGTTSTWLRRGAATSQW